MDGKTGYLGEVKLNDGVAKNQRWFFSIKFSVIFKFSFKIDILERMYNITHRYFQGITEAGRFYRCRHFTYETTNDLFYA
jgi:hypothetical protein